MFRCEVTCDSLGNIVLSPLERFSNCLLLAQQLNLMCVSVSLYLCIKQEQHMLTQVVGAAGMLINTMGWVDGLGFELLLHTIAAMKANIVLVVGQDRLLTQLQTKWQVRTHTQQSSDKQHSCVHYASSRSACGMQRGCCCSAHYSLHVAHNNVNRWRGALLLYAK